MNVRRIFSNASLKAATWVAAAAAGLTSCSPIRTATVSISQARSACLNHTVDFGHDGGTLRPAYLRAAGVELLIHKATGGSGRTDGDYARRELPARAAGLKWGAYHYVKRGASLSGQVHQFVHVVRSTALRHGTAHHPVLLVLDNEGGDRVSWSALASAAQQVRSHSGVWPLLYCSVPQPGTSAFPQQCRELDALSGAQRSVLRSCGLWVPRYGDYPAHRATFSVPRVFGDWTFWQYCGDIGNRPKTALAAPDFSGNVGAAFTRSGGSASLRHFCDRNLFNGSRAQFERFYQDHSSAPATWR